jgi:hypothetical protein
VRVLGCFLSSSKDATEFICRREEEDSVAKNPRVMYQYNKLNNNVTRLEPILESIEPTNSDAETRQIKLHYVLRGAIKR